MLKKTAFFPKLTAFALLIAMLAGPASFLTSAYAETSEEVLQEEISANKSSLEIMNELSEDVEKWNAISDQLDSKFIFEEELSNSDSLENKLENEKLTTDNESVFLQLEKEKIQNLIAETNDYEQKELLFKLLNIIEAEENSLQATENLLSNLQAEILRLELEGKAIEEIKETSSQRTRIISKADGLKIIENAEENKVERIISIGDLKVETEGETITIENAGMFAIKAFLKNTDLLKIDENKFIHLGVKNVSENDGLFSVQLSQVFNGLPVETEYSKVILKEDGSIISIVNNLEFPSISTKPGISTESAIQKAKDAVYWNDSSDSIKESSLVIYENTLAYKVKLSTFNPLGEWTIYINANTGELMEYFNDISFAEFVPVTIKGAILPVHANSQLEYVPLKNIKIQSPKEEFFTNDSGFAMLPVLEHYNVSLETPSYKVRSDEKDEPEFIFQPTIDAKEFILDKTNTTLEQSNVFYHLGMIEDYFRSLGAKLKEKQLVATVRSALVDAYIGGCGSWYNAEEHTIELGRGGCGNQNFALSSDTIYHEFVHSIIYNKYYLKNIPGSESGAINEALADYFATSVNDDSTFGEHSLTFTRNLDNDLSLHTDWKGIIHHDAQILGGTLWDIREELGNEYTDKLVYNTLNFYPTNFQDFLYSIILADDNDADLSNDTPNLEVILKTFAKHGIGPGVEGYEGFEYEPIKSEEECVGDECLILNLLMPPGAACSLAIVNTYLFSLATKTTVLTFQETTGSACNNSDNEFAATVDLTSTATEYPLPPGVIAGGSTFEIFASPYLPSWGKLYVGYNQLLIPALRPAGRCANDPTATPNTSPLDLTGTACTQQIIPSNAINVEGAYTIYSEDTPSGIDVWTYSLDGITPLPIENIAITPTRTEPTNRQFRAQTDHSITLGDIIEYRTNLYEGPSAPLETIITASLANPPPVQVNALIDYDAYMLTVTQIPIVTSVSGGDTVVIDIATDLPEGTYTIATAIQAMEGAGLTYEFQEIIVDAGGLNPLVMYPELYGLDPNYFGTGIGHSEPVDDGPQHGVAAEEDGSGGGLTTASTPKKPDTVTSKECYEAPLDPGVECLPGAPPTFFAPWGFMSNLPPGTAGCGLNCKAFLIPLEPGPGLLTPEPGFDFYDPSGEEGYEWGDAPDPSYPTKASIPATKWIVHPGEPWDFFLGLKSKKEGKTTEFGPNVIDLDPMDDGITITNLTSNGTATVDVEVTIPPGMSGPYFFNGLGDFNRANEWTDLGEWIIQNVDLSQPPYNFGPGENTAQFKVATGKYVDDIWLRFTLSRIPMPGYGPSGQWDGSFIYNPIEGETEDYYIPRPPPKGGSPAFCGNGIVDAYLGEQCDPLDPLSIPTNKICDSKCNLLDIVIPPDSGGGGDDGGIIPTPEPGTTFTDGITISGGAGTGFGHPSRAGIHYSYHELPEILEALIRRDALPPGSTIDVLPIAMHDITISETPFEKIKNYLLGNLAEIFLTTVFVIALLIDIKKLSPVRRKIQEKIDLLRR